MAAARQSPKRPGTGGTDGPGSSGFTSVQGFAELSHEVAELIGTESFAVAWSDPLLQHPFEGFRRGGEDLFNGTYALHPR